MKALVLVDSVNNIPKAHKQSLLVVNQSNWQESFHYLEGKSSDVYMFIHENCPIERLLKLIEEYTGNIAVYTNRLVDPVFLSRFTKVVSRRTINIKNEFNTPSDLEKTLTHLKSVLV